MLHIALPELPGGTEKKMVAHKLRLRMHHGHHILQLITEPKSAAGLIKATPCPKPAGYGLVHQPAVGEHVE